MKIGKVYKIICTQSNDIYIGSTFNTLRDRWRDHKNRYQQYKKNKNRTMSIHNYFDKYGIDNFKIILIKEYEVIDRNHLETKEQLWLNKLKNINIQSAFNPFRRCRKMYYQNRKEKINIRYECECGVFYYARHKIKHEKSISHIYFMMSDNEKKEYDNNIKERKKEYDNNIKERKKEYNEKNKDIIKEKHRQIEICECGGSYYKNCNSKKERHIKTKKHLNYISNNIPVPSK